MISMDMETALKLEIDVLCLCIIAIVAHGEYGRQGGAPTTGTRLFLSMAAATALMIVLDLAAWLVGGLPGPAGRAAVYAANTAYFLFHLLPLVVFFLYADYQLKGDLRRLYRLRLPMAFLYGVGATAALVTPFTGFIFSVNAANHYVRGPGFNWFAGYAFLLCVAVFFFILSQRRLVSRRVLMALVSYPVPVVAAAALQNLFYGLVLIWPAMTLFLVISSYNIQRAQASTDHLTGAANRRSLDEDLEERIAAARKGHRFGAILVDLDDFKSINDRLGHELGDRALEDAASVLKGLVRTDDLVARYGGDEFVIVLGLGDEGRLADVVARLRRAVTAFNEGSGRPYRLSFSVGAGLFDAAADRDGRGFLSRIDALMYADKAARKA